MGYENGWSPFGLVDWAISTAKLAHTAFGPALEQEVRQAAEKAAAKKAELRKDRNSKDVETLDADRVGMMGEVRKTLGERSRLDVSGKMDGYQRYINTVTAEMAQFLQSNAASPHAERRPREIHALSMELYGVGEQQTILDEKVSPEFITTQVTRWATVWEAWKYIEGRLREHEDRVARGEESVSSLLIQIEYEQDLWLRNRQGGQGEKEAQDIARDLQQRYGIQIDAKELLTMMSRALQNKERYWQAVYDEKVKQGQEFPPGSFALDVRSLDALRQSFERVLNDPVELAAFERFLTEDAGLNLSVEDVQRLLGTLQNEGPVAEEIKFASIESLEQKIQEVEGVQRQLREGWQKLREAHGIKHAFPYPHSFAGGRPIDPRTLTPHEREMRKFVDADTILESVRKTLTSARRQAIKQRRERIDTIGLVCTMSSAALLAFLLALYWAQKQARRRDKEREL